MSDSVRPHRQQPTRLPRPWDSSGKNTEVGCHFLLQYVKVKSESEVAQSCPTLGDTMDYSLPGSSIHGIFPGKSTGVGCHFLLQGIFLTQGLNPGLPHCRQTLYCLSHQESLLKNIPNIFSHYEHFWLIITTWQYSNPLATWWADSLRPYRL